MEIEFKSFKGSSANSSRLRQDRVNRPAVPGATSMELTYEGKESEENLLKRLPVMPIQRVREYGKTWYEDWYNMLILGDNLLTVRSLFGNKIIKGNIRLVYIDPPFSTSQDFNIDSERVSTISRVNGGELAYTDRLTGNDYIEFIRKRLILLREIMADNATIYLHIDWKMGHYAKVIMDEIFGQNHFINDITRIKCNPKNFQRKAYGNIKDMILVYSKSSNYLWNESLQHYSPSQIERLFPKTDKQGRRYTTNPLHAPGETRNGPTGKQWKGKLPPKGRHWRYSPDVLDDLDKRGLIEWSSTGNPRKIIHADDYVIKKTKRQDIWEFKDPAYPTYPTEKNLDMLKVIIDASTDKDDIVLDCFSGSGTTLLAAEDLGRRWIGVDGSPVAIKSSLQRLRRFPHTSPFVLSYCGQEADIPDSLRDIADQKNVLG